MKKIRLTEKDLHNIVSNTVKRIINENGGTPKGLQPMQEVKKTKVFRMTESDLHGIISKAVKKYLKEDVGMTSDSWYDEEDYNGKVGQVGMIRSYDIGYMTTDHMEQMAQEEGFSDMAQAITYWWNEVSSECPWTWIPQGHGYGHNGTTIAKIGNVVIKDIYGQIMIDEYPPIG